MARSANREAVAYFEQALSALPHLPTPRETHEHAIDLRLALHYPLLMLGELERMLNHLRQAETLAESLGDQRRLGWVSIYMTYYCWFIGDLDRALAAGLRALTIATDLGDVALQVRTHRVLGCAYHAGGDYHRALDLFRPAMEGFADHHIPAHFRLTGLPSVGVNAWLLWCLADLGEFAEGMARGGAMGQAADGVNDPAERAEACFGTGILYLYKGDLPQAIARLERGLGHCQSDNLLVWFPPLAVALGHAYTLAGRVPEALPLLERAVELDASMGIMGGHMLSLTWLSEAHLLMESTEKALQIAARAFALSSEHHERGNQAYALRLLGAIAAHGDPSDGAPAEAYYRQALALAEALGMRPLQAHCQRGLGMLYTATGQREQARAALAAASALYQDMDMTFWLSQTEAALAQAQAQ